MLLIAASCLAVGSAGAAIYRCVDHGRTSFRDKPCSGKEQQTRLGAGQAVYAGCYQLEDSSAWEGGAGAWRFEIAFTDGNYVFKDVSEVKDGAAQEPQAANVPMHRASPEELEAAAQQLTLKVTSGIVLELPDSSAKRAMGLFNAWDASGRLQLVAYLPFANGLVRRVACP